MITRSKFLIGLVVASTFAFSPLASAGGRHGGGGHHGGSSGGFNHRGTHFNHGGNFHRGGGFNRGGHFGHHGHHGHFRHHGGVIYVDPFYYGFGWGYPYGYGYGYPAYGGYYAEPDYDVGDYAVENYSPEVDVQTALADLGYYNGPIDGIIGSGTRRAVRAFQRDNGLPVTGRIDRRLLNALRAS